MNAGFINTNGDWLVRLYSNGAGSPGSQIGSNGASLTINSTGDKTFNGAADMTVSNGTVYWIVIAPASGTPSMDLSACANDASFGSGHSDTITSITDSLPSSRDWRKEIVAT